MSEHGSVLEAWRAHARSVSMQRSAPPPRTGRSSVSPDQGDALRTLQLASPFDMNELQDVQPLALYGDDADGDIIDEDEELAAAPTPRYIPQAERLGLYDDQGACVFAAAPDGAATSSDDDAAVERALTEGRQPSHRTERSVEHPAGRGRGGRAGARGKGSTGAAAKKRRRN